MRLLTACLAALGFLRATIPRVRPLFRSRRPRTLAPSLELVTRLPAGTAHGGGQVSHVPGEPWCALALFLDPGGTAGPGPLVQRRGPRASHGEGYPHCRFRGCMARLWRWLSTLRSAGSPLLHARLASGCGQLYRTGLVTRRVPTKGFQSVSLHNLPPFPSFRDARLARQ